jgi:hypothetical protein
MLRREDLDILSRRGKAWIVTAENLSQFGLATKKEGRPSHLFSEDSDSRKP